MEDFSWLCSLRERRLMGSVCLQDWIQDPGPGLCGACNSTRDVGRKRPGWLAGGTRTVESWQPSEGKAKLQFVKKKFSVKQLS